MDIEIGQNNTYSDEESVLIFLNINYFVKYSDNNLFQRQTKNNSLPLLKGTNGVIRSGRLTFILGPSGAGKTTLLNILAGRKKNGVSGVMCGAGSNVVLVPQHTILIDCLTVQETLEFAAALKLPNETTGDRCRTIEKISKQLGVYDVHNTRAGNLSGGERKRLAIACELITDPHIMLLDEPTSGLDSVSSMSVAQALQSVAHSGKTVACVIHQPSSQLFACADDVMLLTNGKTIYSGALCDIPKVLKKYEYECPLYYNMADYLLEVANEENIENLALLENEARTFTNEFKKSSRINEIFKIDIGQDNSLEEETLLKSNMEYVSNYNANFKQQMIALLRRGFIVAMRDVHLTQLRVVTHLIVALLLGALYTGAGEEAHRMMSNTGCIFFFILFLYFSNAMPTINSFPVESKVILQEHLNKWYYLSTYCTSKILIDLPIQLLCATVFFFPAWTLTSQPLNSYRMWMAWLVCGLITILAQTFGLVVGAACGIKIGLFAIPAANIPMLMFSGFFIPYDEMPSYLKPLALISYFRYAFDAIMKLIYGFEREALPCNKIFCIFTVPSKYLTHLGLTTEFSTDIAALVIWIVILKILLICVLNYRVHKACR